MAKLKNKRSDINQLFLYDKNIDAIIISDIGEYLLEEEDEDYVNRRILCFL